jgi:hypothetical protein
MVSRTKGQISGKIFIKYLKWETAAVAQLVEHSTTDPEIESSNLAAAWSQMEKRITPLSHPVSLNGPTAMEKFTQLPPPPIFGIFQNLFINLHTMFANVKIK